MPSVISSLPVSSSVSSTRIEKNNLYTEDDFSIDETNNSSSTYEKSTNFLEVSLGINKQKFQNQILNAIKNYDSEDLYESEVDVVFSEFYQQYELRTVEWLNFLLLKNLKNQSIVLGILKLLSRINYDKVASFGQTMLLLILYHNQASYKNSEITEMIIRCIENWEDKGFISILEDLDTQANFLERYKYEVLKDLVA